MFVPGVADAIAAFFGNGVGAITFVAIAFISILSRRAPRHGPNERLTSTNGLRSVNLR